MKIRTGIGAFVLAAALALNAAACGGSFPLVSEVRGEDGYTDAQTMLVIATEGNRYRKVYTDQIWQVPVKEDGTNFQTYLLGEIKSFLTQLKTMNLLAQEQNVRLTSQEKEQLKALSQSFYDSLTKEDKAYIQAGEDDVYQMYEEYHVANRLVDELTKDVNLEISDSEAKVITVQEIQVSDEAQAEAAYAQATAEGASFSSVARSVSENPEIQVSVGRSERGAAYEEPVFALTEGSISQPFSYEGKWYVVKCVDEYDEEATLERKERLAVQRKDQAFRQIYDTFAAEHPVEVGGELWETVSLAEHGGSTTTDFFERYQEVMEQ